MSNNERIAKNTLYLYLRMFFILIISLYTSRVILNVLGIIDYGIYSVVAGFVSLFGFLNATLSSSMQRYYNYELGSNGETGVARVYSTGLRIHFIIALCLFLVLESFGVWYINSIMVIPKERLFAANIVFQAVAFSMILIILQIPYLGAILAYERMNYYSLVGVLDIILKLVIVLILPLFRFDKLIVYSILLLFVSLFDFLAYYIYSKHYFRGLEYRKEKDNAMLRGMLSFSSWNLVGTFAFMLKGQGVNMLLNSFFGPIVNAARGVAFQVNSAVNSFSGSISTAFRPQIVDSYARNEYQRVQSLFFSEGRICYSLILFIIIPIIMELDFILHLWLGDTLPQNTNSFTILVLFDLLICTINPSIGQVAFATGDIKRYQIANSCINILLIPFCWFFLRLGYSAHSAFILTIVFSILNQAVCLIELNRVFRIRIKEYLLTVIFPCVVVTVLAFIPQVVLHLLLAPSLFRVVLVCLLDLVFTGALVYFVVLTKTEKSLLKAFVFKAHK